MAGIESIRRLERETDGPGIVRTVHEWRAAASLPPAFQRHVEDAALTWIERGWWDEGTLTSRWTVESRLLAGGLAGSGTTRLAGAMGGRGTRVQLEVSTALEPGALGPLGQGRWKDGLEDTAARVLTKTLQDLCVAVEVFLAEGGGQGGAGDGVGNGKRGGRRRR